MAPRPRVNRIDGLIVPLLSAVALGVLGVTPQAQEAVKPPQDAATITVEGCLTKEGGSSTSTAAEQFVLTVTHAPQTTAPTATTGGAAPAPPHKTMYVLRSAPEPPRPFNTMIDNYVRVTGATTAPATTAPLAGRSPEATPYPAPVATPAPGGASSPTGTAFDTANLPTLVVHAISSVASRCR